MTSRQDRIAGGLVGLLVGDALGVPYEFYPPEEVPPEEQIEFAPPAGFRPAHYGVPPGTWSDDGAHALCLLTSLLRGRSLYLPDLGERLLSWYRHGLMAVDGKVFDIGNQTARALAALQSGVPAAEAGPAGERDNGNGSLMRVLPLALLGLPDADLIRLAAEQSLVTHGHIRSRVCCAVYCLWARYTLDQADDPWASAVAAFRAELRGSVPHFKDWLDELEREVRPDDPPGGRGGGYVVDCLNSARWAVQQGGSYEQVVRRAIRLGNDTDTTACVAGGIAGLRVGLGGIPGRWVEGLRGRELYEPLLRELLALGV